MHKSIIDAKVRGGLCSSVSRALELLYSHCDSRGEAMYRGQSNAYWGLVPSLFRVPNDSKTVHIRQRYTENFLKNLIADEGVRSGLDELTDAQLQALAQHYGFYTDLLDFTYDPSIAAFFSVNGASPAPKYGMLLRVSICEFNTLKSEWGEGELQASGYLKLLNSDSERQAALENLRRKYIDDAIPDLEIVELPPQVKRVHRQSGLFVRIRQGNTGLTESWLNDSYVFQHQNHDSTITNRDGLEHFHDSAPSELKRTYENLFPENDEIYEYTKWWKKRNPDPSGVNNTNASFVTTNDSNTSKKVSLSSINRTELDENQKKFMQIHLTIMIKMSGQNNTPCEIYVASKDILKSAVEYAKKNFEFDIIDWSSDGSQSLTELEKIVASKKPLRLGFIISSKFPILLDSFLKDLIKDNIFNPSAMYVSDFEKKEINNSAIFIIISKNDAEEFKKGLAHDELSKMGINMLYL